MILAVDFDGTLVCDEFPDLGFPNMELLHALVEVRKRGHKVILWTCRSGDHLVQAVYMMKELGLEFDAINCNLPDIVEKYGGDTRKVYADIYIDDKACRMFVPHNKSYSQYVLEAMLEEEYLNALRGESAKVGS